jgi:outer membrane protein assembly factor BamB
MEALIIGSNGSVAAINPGDGGVIWKTDLKTGGWISATSHEDVSVLIRKGMVFAGCCGHLFCLELGSGEVRWHNPLSGFGHNDLSLAMEGVAVQFLQKEERRN